MKTYELVRQEDSMGCGIACVASRLGKTYQETKGEFSNPENALSIGYFCEDLIEVLSKHDLNYAYKKIGTENKFLLEKEGTIVFAKRDERYVEGHWLTKTNRGWMNPWINFPNGIEDSIAGYELIFPGTPEWIVHEK